MRYVVYGAGAVGATIGARLFEHGREVVLIARGEHYRVLARDGLWYSDPEATRVLPIPVVDHPGALTWAADVVVLAMKGQDTEPALRVLEAVAPPDVVLLCAQNGIENERTALRRFPHVYGMCVMMPATNIEPGVVDADSLPIVGVLDVGRYPSGVDAVAEGIAADLAASGFRSRADPAIMGWKHEKLLHNLMTPVRALCGPDGDDDADAAVLRREVAERLEAEALACYERAGVVRPTAEERAARWDGAVTMRPIPGRPRGAGSGWQSLARGTGTIESDYVNGEITLLGRLHGVPTPANELVQRWSIDLARQKAAPGSVPLRDLADALPPPP